MGTERDAKERNKLFSEVYRQNLWRSAESVSGQGSAVWICEPLITQLPLLLQKYDIGSMLDIPCGDFNWMQHVRFPDGFTYIGGDIVPDMVADNNGRYRNDCLDFRVLDVVDDSLPSVDLIFIRDLFIHLTLSVCRRSIENIAMSDFEYAMFTHDPLSSRYPPTGNIELDRAKHGANYEFRPVSMRLPPFNFPAPLDSITEHRDHAPVWQGQKQMALWSKEQIVMALHV